MLQSSLKSVKPSAALAAFMGEAVSMKVSMTSFRSQSRSLLQLESGDIAK